MNKFKKYNLIAGWFSFAFAAVVYLMTIEPTASFWDCSEFIATSYKLEVGHPPGAPLFMMISRFFSIFAPSPQYVAMMVNSMSALASAATIMFLFWSITHLARKAYRKEETELTNAQITAIIGAGLIGAIAYTFTDTFWFSAVEGEVYALSSLFTAVVFWAILKWENVADEPHANRWIILIAYLIGLSIGVHLLNLLLIPAVGLIYYFRKNPVITKWGICKALIISAAILVAIMFIIIPGTVTLGAFIDRIFVNTFGLPINSGITTYAIALLAALGWGIYYTYKNGKVILNTVILCTTVIIIGYGSYASVIIRASVNPPMNSNNPSNPYALLSLLNRDQYGARPLLKGPYYSSPLVSSIEKKTYYVGDDGKYKPATIGVGYKAAPGFNFFFPRMHSHRPGDAEAYKNWMDIKGRNIPYNDQMINVPTFGENLEFFFSYQLNFMFWRYFLWNFVGRQSDVQSTGQITDGNWMSGIDAIDQIYLGPRDNLPSEAASNKGMNKYYFLPFILGIIGLIFQLNRDGRNFTVVMTLFIMTGVAIAVYLNSPPVEPRERDYVYAGAFYAFAIWIGFGVLAIFEAIKKWFKKENVATAAIATAICTCVPAILGAQNWDDHDRSGRYVARDFGKNYLNSTLPNSIIMNYGDNDAFPLWYAQEVEGVRPDVKVMNMSYLGAEWYIDQMRVKSNDADPVPFSIPREKYTYNNEQVFVVDFTNGKPMDIRLALEYFKSDDPKRKLPLQDGTMVNIIPSKVLAIPVNKENAIKSGIVKPEDASLMVDTVYLTIPGNSVLRNDLMMLDLLANFNWERPLYFSQSQSIGEYGLRDYLQLDGFAYRLVPIKTPVDNLYEVGRVDSEYLYDKLMNQFEYGNVDDPKVNADYFIQINFMSVQARNVFARLAKQLIAEGDTTRAIEVLDRAIEKMPFNQIKHSPTMTLPLIEAYYMAGEIEKGNAILSDYANILKEYVAYYMRFPEKKADQIEQQFNEKISILVELYRMAKEVDTTNLTVSTELKQHDSIVSDIENFFKEQGLIE